jgi:4a-hydroxytetrahydrobiopterin dehydratase
MGSELSNRHCQRDTTLLTDGATRTLLAQIHTEWSSIDNGKGIQRTFHFKNYYQTIAFVNALAWVAHAEDHHPDLTVGYNRCVVNYSTHSVGGVSENDFICAARIDALIADNA